MDLPRAKARPDGTAYLPASAFLTETAAAAVGGEWDRCPVWEMSATHELASIYRRHRAGVQRVSEAFGEPSEGLIEAMEVLHGAGLDIEAAEVARITAKPPGGG